MKLPHFLLADSKSSEPSVLEQIFQRYKDHFGEIDFHTINAGFTDEEWAAIVDYCIKHDKHYTDVFGSYDSDALY